MKFRVARRGKKNDKGRTRSRIKGQNGKVIRRRIRETEEWSG